MVSIVGDGEEVRRNFVAFLPFVYLGHFGAIDGQPLVRVDRHAEEAGIGLEVGEISTILKCEYTVLNMYYVLYCIIVVQNSYRENIFCHICCSLCFCYIYFIHS